MSLRIQNNIAAVEAQRNLGISSAGFNKSLQRLSSGYRINNAADDAAGLSVSQGLRADIASQQVASRNISEANSLLQTAEGSMDQIGNMLTRLKELATQAASANASGNLAKINAEGNTLLDEIDRIANSTEYAGTKLLDGTFGVAVSGGSFTAGDGLSSAKGLESAKTYTVIAATSGAGQVNITISATLGSVGSERRVSQTIYDVAVPGTGNTTDVSFESLGLTVTFNSSLGTTAAGGETITSTTATASDFQIGAKAAGENQIGVSLDSVLYADLGLAKDKLDTAADAQAFLTTLDTAISTLNTLRGNVGASQNRLGYASANLDTTIQNNMAADSVIRDVDMASEMTAFTKNQILMQAGTSMLAQANMAPQQVLSLFQ